MAASSSAALPPRAASGSSLALPSPALASGSAAPTPRAQPTRRAPREPNDRDAATPPGLRPRTRVASGGGGEGALRYPPPPSADRRSRIGRWRRGIAERPLRATPTGATCPRTLPRRVGRVAVVGLAGRASRRVQVSRLAGPDTERAARWKRVGGARRAVGAGKARSRVWSSRRGKRQRRGGRGARRKRSGRRARHQK